MDHDKLVEHADRFLSRKSVFEKYKLSRLEMLKLWWEAKKIGWKYGKPIQAPHKTIPNYDKLKSEIQIEWDSLPEECLTPKEVQIPKLGFFKKLILKYQARQLEKKYGSAMNEAKLNKLLLDTENIWGGK